MKLRETEPIGFRCPQDVLDRIDAIASRLGTSRSNVCRNLILMGLEDAELLNNMGVLRGYEFFKRVLYSAKPELKEASE